MTQRGARTARALDPRRALAAMVAVGLTLGGASARAADSGKLDILAVLDDSGSMKLHDPGFLTGQVVAAFLEGLSDQSHIGVVIFSDRARLAMPLSPMSEPETRERVQASVASLSYTGQRSDLGAAIERAVYEFTHHGRKDARRAIVFLTDGIIDTGNLTRDSERRRWLREDLAQEAHMAGINVFGIAFTEEADFELIQSISFKTGGGYFRAFDSQEIPAVFEAVRASLLARPAPPTTQAAERQPAPAQPSDPEMTATTEGSLPPGADQAARAGTATAASMPAPAPIAGLSGGLASPYLPWLFALAVGLMSPAVIMFALRNRLGPGAEQVKVPEAHLFDLDDATNRSSYLLRQAVTRIGRVATNDIWIDHDTISALHATIEYRDNAFILKDRKSTNGTFINNRRIRQEELKGGDVLAFHEYKFRFMLPSDGEIGDTVIATRTSESGKTF